MMAPMAPVGHMAGEPETDFLIAMRLVDPETGSRSKMMTSRRKYEVGAIRDSTARRRMTTARRTH